MFIGMNSFIMKTLTLDNKWFEFTLADVPTLQNHDQFVLMNKPDTPILKVKHIMRGDIETGLYEGDVIQYKGRPWLVCYERGFRIINSEYVIQYLYHVDRFKRIGRYNTVGGLPTVTFKLKFLFKYEDHVLRLSDIIGAYEGKILMRTHSRPIEPGVIQQDCGLRYNNKLVYLGDIVNNSPVELRGGRITITNEVGEIIDLATGGVLDGYIPRGTRRD